MRCALVRIVVLFIKRQWPADWPTLLEELKNSIQYGVRCQIHYKLMHGVVSFREKYYQSIFCVWFQRINQGTKSMHLYWSYIVLLMSTGGSIADCTAHFDDSVPRC